MVEQQLRLQLNPTDTIRVIFETDSDLLRHLPWHCWDFFQDYPHAEMALSQLAYQHRDGLFALSGTRNTSGFWRLLATVVAWT